jgi:hypothetical protein
VFLAKQFEQVTAHKHVERSIPEWKLAGVGARAMGIRTGVRISDFRLGLGRHIGREIDTDRLPARIGTNQPVEHFPGAHGDFKHRRAIPDVQHLHRLGVSIRVEEAA